MDLRKSLLLLICSVFTRKEIVKWGLFFIFPLLLSPAVWGLTNADKLAIEALVAKFDQSWNDKQGAGFSDLYTNNGDFINIYGMHITGNSDIELRHKQILKTFLKDSKLHTDNISLKEITPEVVSAYVMWTIKGYREPGTDNKIPGETRKGVFTHIFLHQDNQWLITTTQNTMSPK
jgi:uncharacterized protein (TIGR02246 family)